MKLSKVLNLYACIGGNRKFWDESASVTAVEIDPKIASVYGKLYPSDTVVIADAHEYLLKHYQRFDFVWSSPPCQTHTGMEILNKRNEKRYADLGLYQEIIFLQTFFSGLWCVENVEPYYPPLIQPTRRVGRHLFWANFPFFCEDIKRPESFINLDTKDGKKILMDWLGIHFEESIYYEGNHCPAQILRNCVHPEIGRQIYNAAQNHASGIQIGKPLELNFSIPPADLSTRATVK